MTDRQTQRFIERNWAEAIDVLKSGRVTPSPDAATWRDGSNSSGRERGASSASPAAQPWAVTERGRSRSFPSVSACTVASSAAKGASLSPLDARASSSPNAAVAAASSSSSPDATAVLFSDDVQSRASQSAARDSVATVLNSHPHASQHGACAPVPDLRRAAIPQFHGASEGRSPSPLWLPTAAVSRAGSPEPPPTSSLLDHGASTAAAAPSPFALRGSRLAYVVEDPPQRHRDGDAFNTCGGESGSGVYAPTKEFATPLKTCAEVYVAPLLPARDDDGGDDGGAEEESDEVYAAPPGRHGSGSPSPRATTATVTAGLEAA